MTEQPTEHVHEFSTGIASSNGMVTKRFCIPCKHWIALDEPVPIRQYLDETQGVGGVHDAGHDD